MEFQPPKGTKDYMLEDAERLQSVTDIVRGVFERFGFRPLFTPAFEDFGLLSVKGGLGEAVRDEIYYFKDKSDRELGLRFDLTMPMVRVVASNQQLQKPFRRYAIGFVWRYENPQSLRYREFVQADVDIVGSQSLRADAECAAVACECLDRLGFKDYYIRTNNRKILQTIFDKLIGTEKVKGAFRTIDKLDKIGVDGVKAELEQKGIPPKEVLRFLRIQGSNKSMIGKLRKIYGDNEGIAEMEKMFSLAKEFGIEKRLKFDVSLVRGLDYYTGPLFEIYMGERFGCGGGGRYDNLIRDIGGPATPATGISLGISRIFEVMKERDMFGALGAGEPKVFVANVDDESFAYASKLAAKLRKKGIACEIDSMGRKLGGQLEYADGAKFRYAIIVGKNEIASGRFKLKDMRANTEEGLPLARIAQKIKSSNKGARRAS
ncbi:MAG: histidine--tRNA ligase [Candidatus Aenigmatarchaeota archaeon]